MTKGPAFILAAGLFASSVMIYLGLREVGKSIREAEIIQKRVELSVEGSKSRPLRIEAGD